MDKNRTISLVWNIIPKATKEQDELQLIDTDNGRVFQREKRKEIGKKKGKEGKIYVDGRIFDFGQ